ncbi:MAG TPA: Maf family protein [Edaphocola sp.]|nr:Maf family protein [Edaphocola sp.]
MKHLILASQSPRRKQLLAEAGLTFRVRSVPTDERYPETMPAAEVAAHIAKGKAEALWHTLSSDEQAQSIILASDTIVVSGNRILGKPKDSDEAITFLKLLSGREHDVITGVYLLSTSGQHDFCIRTKVYFRPLTDEQVAYYVRQYKPFDKAGAYAIQEWIGMVGIEKIEGDYYNVVGLPVGEVLAALKSFCPDLDGLI